MGSYLHKGGNFQKRLWVAANITWKWLDCQDCWEKEMSIAIALPNFSKFSKCSFNEHFENFENFSNVMNISDQLAIILME